MEKKYIDKFDVHVVKMIRNNNIVYRDQTDEKVDAYFMLDYFDLLYHISLTGDQKIYTKFWHLESDNDNESLEYKASYKTLSLYAEAEGDIEGIWSRNDHQLTDFPFLGVIQINIIFGIYNKEPDLEHTLSLLSDRIMEEAKQVAGKSISDSKETGCQMLFRLYKSSTSSDFCLIVKSYCIKSIFEIATFINNLTIRDGEERFTFNTYTNVGIECVRNAEGQFMTLSQDIIEKNEECSFILRISAACKEVADKYSQLEESNTFVEGITYGLFGRYDFLVKITIVQFAELYPTLCKSKMLGYDHPDVEEIPDSAIKLLKQGIETGDIKIINERVLVPITDKGLRTFEFKDESSDSERKLRNAVKKIGNELWDKLDQYYDLKKEFLEERRAYIDIGRELKEIISTYVPQGMDSDSHVNWQILVSDLQVLFECVDKWHRKYCTLEDTDTKKKERVHFLEDLRMVVEAINNFYKFIQNVNAQTWQAPVYEIQTQLDAEKMMIAYREVIFQYMEMYRTAYDDKPRFYPIIYPDMSINNPCILAPFKNGVSEKRLLICKVPSFEYYGRMYNMLPWIMHEASHSFRTLKREERNRYLVTVILRRIYQNALYKVLNTYTNDYGYHYLGALENNLIRLIAEKIFCSFVEREPDYKDDGIDRLTTRLLDYLHNFFSSEGNAQERYENKESLQKIQADLLGYLKKLGVYDASCLRDLEKCSNNSDSMASLLKRIFNALYQKIWGVKPSVEEYLIIIENELFENRLNARIEDITKGLKVENIDAKAQEYRYNLQKLHLLYAAWRKKRENVDEELPVYTRNIITSVRKYVEESLKNGEGIPETYRIINMIFGSGNVVCDNDQKHVKKIFDVLSHSELHEIAAREIKMYREICADLYMSAALGLGAIGYCRWIFQTISDMGVEYCINWRGMTNSHRFRVVVAILLSKEGISRGADGMIPTETLNKQGQIYCVATLKCMEQNMLRQSNEKGGVDKEKADRDNRIHVFIEHLKDTVKEIFSMFQKKGEVRSVLENSAISFYSIRDMQTAGESERIESKKKEVQKYFEPIEDIIAENQHVLYRVKYFIYALNMFGEQNQMLVDREEYEHMKALYDDFADKIKVNDEFYRYVAEYYNDPESAVDKPANEMLEETISFIKKYYYSNRFKIMSSEEVKGEVAENGK